MMIAIVIIKPNQRLLTDIIALAKTIAVITSKSGFHFVSASEYTKTGTFIV